MEPIKVDMLPIKYNIDKELLNLISEANEGMVNINQI